MSSGVASARKSSTPASSAGALLRRNLGVYGLGGLVLPFVGIKIIDLIVQFIPGLR